MSRSPRHNQNNSPKTEAELKQQRLAEALRANLRRRKDQKRGRDDAPASPATNKDISDG